MFEDYQICPYTGLRSFTEEESIYFKGQDEHIQQATVLLEKNKFLMLTGASGDGKSSLVFAGIIPYAKSGFLKSKYSNWSVVSFRPERSPLNNLSQSLAEQFDIPNVKTVESELSHGFSALADLYKSSKRYLDENSNEWTDADDTKKASIKRDATNLIILVDQFEEFFTNPENYHRGVPSVESGLTINLLLETARIALEEHLPIYVIFTMRSDYIGQCAAFRGLPEYIGFSQFFVPRMNRKQLQEVIEEPATLSGNTISRRLTERLIEDITDGTDQLPMLQHALNQIWKMADSSKEEMDLIHYAMVGGITSGDLPDDDEARFVKWFDELPEKIKICYDESSLQNVLNTHANKLNNHAADYVNQHENIMVSEEDTKLIIQNTFKCLTKINEGRAVRNRMTLEEITKIINKSHIDSKTVNLVLNVFRDSSNTLLKPFIGDNEEDWNIDDSTVLDITHESLIRNWTRLDEWAKTEIDDYTVFLDFQQQLQRWVENERSGDFLLSIGPLTYFEDWFKKKQPNKYWIARYASEVESEESKLEASGKVLNEAKAFIKASARSHFVTRTVMRYGPKRIAVVISLIAILILSSFTLKTYLDRTDASMRTFLMKKMGEYTNDPTIARLNITAANIEQLRLQDATPDEIANQIISYKDKVDIIDNTVSWILINSAGVTSPENIRLLAISDSILNVELSQDASLRDFDFLLKESNDMMAILNLLNYYSPGEEITKLLKSNNYRTANLVKFIVENNAENFGETSQLNTAIEHVLNSNMLTKVEILSLLEKLSPFEIEYENSSWLKENYKKAKLYEIGQGNQGSEGINFTGLYQQVAYLYAAVGNIKMALQATDTLLNYNGDYPNKSYFANGNNALNIADYFNRYGYITEYYQYIAAYCKKDKVNEIRFYELLMARSKVNAFTSQKLATEGVGFFNRFYNSNLDFVDQTDISIMASNLRTTISESKLDQNEKHFLMALSFKNEGLSLAFLQKNDSLSRQSAHIKSLFDRSFDYFNSLPLDYLKVTIPSVGSVTSNLASITRKNLFLYPDKMYTFLPFQSFFGFRYSSPAFVEYIINNKLIEKHYRNNLELIDEWFTEYTANYTVVGFLDVLELTNEFNSQLLESVKTFNKDEKSNLSLLYLILGNHASDDDNLEAAIAYYKNVDLEQLVSKFQFFGFFNQSVMLRISQAIRDLYRNGQIEIVNKYIQGFNNPINRSSLYAMAAKEAIIKHGKYPYVDQLIDSAYAEMNLVKNTDSQPNKNLIAAALAFRNEGNDIEEAIKVIKNERRKAEGIWWISRGLAFNNDLYRSYDLIPDNLSDDDVCGYLYEVYHDYKRDNRPKSALWVKWEYISDNADTRIRYIR